jgi:hypothetical protein
VLKERRGEDLATDVIQQRGIADRGFGSMTVLYKWQLREFQVSQDLFVLSLRYLYAGDGNPKLVAGLGRYAQAGFEDPTNGGDKVNLTHFSQHGRPKPFSPSNSRGSMEVEAFQRPFKSSMAPPCCCFPSEVHLSAQLAA